jgi:hypothetical protein
MSIVSRRRMRVTSANLKQMLRAPAALQGILLLDRSVHARYKVIGITRKYGCVYYKINLTFNIWLK